MYVPWEWQVLLVLYRQQENPSFELADDEVEIGMGIHGEPGHREKIRSVAETTDTLIEKILQGIYNAGDEVAVMVNGLAQLFTGTLSLNLRVSEALAEKKHQSSKDIGRQLHDIY